MSWCAPIRLSTATTSRPTALCGFGFDPAEEKKLDDEFDNRRARLKPALPHLTPGRAHRTTPPRTRGRRAASPAVEQRAGEPGRAERNH